ncbi:hypothetical protein [Bradyrhizobium erythrophlei]|uniref:Uncharacterized protein n=1 Tax=Bradyrhizobium erythrophlei TaxID=1437360 RepID=A0A1M5ICW5_9BRAD|nr:hypothetical protein [Bradyrhizobium erythrophlei]SHG25740.1 hypothetical protein SAMN05444169_1459 [Bradyrhizobium erythrophlei]
MPPPPADFSFRIVFKKGQGDPRRIFDAASELIDGFEQLDQAVAGSVDVRLQPVMVLDDIKAGSIRVLLSSLLKKIDEAKLVAALDSLQDGKRLLGPKDKLMLEAPGHKTYDVDLTKTWDPSEIIPLDKTTTEKHSEGEIILTIRKPDMVGNSKWQFARGKFPVFAKITDEDWLSKFHNRKVKGLHSGDAMRCKVRFTYIFDDKGTMIEEQIEITKVIEIIEGSGGEQLPIPL